jgi:uncharacterized protein YdhG (YjbR/CyaY superfamily)
MRAATPTIQTTTSQGYNLGISSRILETKQILSKTNKRIQKKHRECHHEISRIMEVTFPNIPTVTKVKEANHTEVEEPQQFRR